jgi:hypothetical protein
LADWNDFVAKHIGLKPQTPEEIAAWEAFKADKAQRERQEQDEWNAMLEILKKESAIRSRQDRFSRRLGWCILGAFALWIGSAFIGLLE